MNTSYLTSVRKSIKYWYIPLIIGIFFIFISIIIFMRPAESLATLAVLFSFLFLITGLFEIIFYISNRKRLDNWGWYLTYGILTLILGIILVSNLALSMQTLALFIGFVLLFRSVTAIGSSMEMKKYRIYNWGWLLAFSILSMIVSIILILNPIIAGLSLVIIVAINFFFAGILNIYLSIQFRKIQKSSKKISSHLQKRYDDVMRDIETEWNK